MDISNLPRLSTIAIQNGDIAIGGGGFKIAYGRDNFLVQIHSAIKTIKGEVLLNPDEGIDYFGTIFNNNAVLGPQVWAERVLRRLKEFPFVESILKFDYKYDKGVLTYELNVKTIDGEITDSSEFYLSDEKTPTEFRPLRGQKIKLENDMDVFMAAKKIVKTLGGETMDDLGPVEVPDSEYKPMTGDVENLTNTNGLYESTKSIAEFLGATVE